jgi:hypothetical protein
LLQPLHKPPAISSSNVVQVWMSRTNITSR